MDSAAPAAVGMSEEFRESLLGIGWRRCGESYTAPEGCGGVSTDLLSFMSKGH